MKLESLDYEGIRDYLDKIENAEVKLYYRFVFEAIGYCFLIYFFSLGIIVSISAASNLIEYISLYVYVALLTITVLAYAVRYKICSKIRYTAKYFKYGNSDFKVFYFFKRKIKFLDTANKHLIVYNKKKKKVKVYSYSDELVRTFWNISLHKDDIVYLDNFCKHGFESVANDTSDVNNMEDKDSQHNLDKGCNLSKLDKQSEKYQLQKQKYDQNDSAKLIYPNKTIFKKSTKGNVSKIKYYSINNKRSNHYMLSAKLTTLGCLVFKDCQIVKHFTDRRYDFEKYNSTNFEVRLPNSFVLACKEKGHDLTNIDCIKIERDDC